MDFLIDFEWQRPRDPQCFRIVVTKVPERLIVYPRQGRRGPRSLPRLKAQWGFAYTPVGIDVLIGSQPHFIRLRDQPDLVRYRPLDAFGSVLLPQFLRIDTPEEVLDFVRRFGPLTAEGLHAGKGDLVEGVAAHARAMREFLFSHPDDQKTNAELAAMQTSPFAELEVSLAPDLADGTLRLRFVPASLLDALWLLAVQKLLRGAVVRKCKHCGRPFEAGPGAHRRIDAEFCSDQHKIEFFSLERTRKKQRRKA